MDLFVREWFVDQAKGAIVLVHGMAEHSGRYEHVADVLNREGYSVLSGDLPGWGQSPGLKGHIYSFDEYISAVGTWVSLARAHMPEGHPIFILGHSLGGLVATRFVQEYADQQSLAGLILSSPCLQLKIEVPAWKEQLAQLLDKIMPTLRLSNEISPEQVTRDAKQRKLYAEDPLNYKKVSVRLFKEMHAAMRKAWEKTMLIKLPVLVMQAADDLLIDPAAVERFVGQLPSPDKQFQSFPHLYHEIFNEPEKEIVMSHLLKWLQAREQKTSD